MTGWFGLAGCGLDGWKVVVMAGMVALSGSAQASAARSSQAQTLEVTANAIIPQPVPSAPLSDWTSTRTRQTVTLEREGVTLRGWRFRAPRAGAPTLLFFNGNGMTIGESEPLYRRIAEAGAEVVVFDYRGYGFSGGVADVAAFRQDALAEYDWLVQQAGGPVAVYGFSLGTVMATSVAAQRPVKGLILAGTIASAAEEMPIYARAHGLPEEQIQAMHLDAGSVEAFDEVGRIAKSQAPLLMLHGEGDRLVPIAEGREVFAASPARQKRFVALPGMAHNQTAGAVESLRAVEEFLGGLR